MLLFPQDSLFFHNYNVTDTVAHQSRWGTTTDYSPDRRSCIRYYFLNQFLLTCRTTVIGNDAHCLSKNYCLHRGLYDIQA
jgi:hypothetical protein